MRDGRREDGGSEVSDPANLLLTEQAAELVLANEVLPGPAAIPELARLRQRMRAGERRRAVVWTTSGLALLGAMGALAMVVSRPAQPARETLAYVVEGAATVQGDSVEAPLPAAAGGTTGNATQATRLRFTDGTAITLDAGTRLRVPARTAAGAELVLDGGRAAFAVVHRPDAAWSVTAGPFVVEVTGTRFNVSWDATDGLRLDLETGGVVVRGAGTGPGVTVHPGETLTGAAVGGRVTVAPTAPGASGRRRRSRPRPRQPAHPTAGVSAPSRPTVPSGAGDRAVGRGRIPGPVRSLAIASPERATSPARLPMSRPDLEPPAVMPSAPSLISGGGGVFCTRERAGLAFEGGTTGVWVPQVYHLAFQRPRHDTTHSWCGTGSVRLDVDFNEAGRRNFMGRLPNQSGQIVFTLPHLMDFTDRTVSLHVFFDGPTDARVAAQIYVIHHGKWVNGPVVDHLVPRRWWTLSHTFRAENPVTVGPPYPPAGTSLVTDCDRIAVVVYSTGGSRTWSGAVYVDDVNWK